ncbi:acyl carrier protein [Streptomyces sp. NBC_00663]|uniref:acyl carrier protein n=1 Tax=Streptomyces sp. NBC_00663 TaxID=2975801 RepID=UPI002E2FE2EB|nr:acyl carrier protein [Streptomyces sp. NBC_00663]
MGTVYDWLAASLVERLKVDPDLIRPGELFRDIGLDSLSQLEVLIWASDAYDVDLDPNDLPDTVGGLAEKIEELRS